LAAAGGAQVLVQIAFLGGQVEGQPLGKHLVVTVPESAVGVLATQQGNQDGMLVPAGSGIPQAGEVRQAAENRRDLRQHLAPLAGGRSFGFVP